MSNWLEEFSIQLSIKIHLGLVENGLPCWSLVMDLETWWVWVDLEFSVSALPPPCPIWKHWSVDFLTVTHILQRPSMHRRGCQQLFTASAFGTLWHCLASSACLPTITISYARMAGSIWGIECVPSMHEPLSLVLINNPLRKCSILNIHCYNCSIFHIYIIDWEYRRK